MALFRVYSFILLFRCVCWFCLFFIVFGVGCFGVLVWVGLFPLYFLLIKPSFRFPFPPN